MSTGGLQLGEGRLGRLDGVAAHEPGVSDGLAGGQAEPSTVGGRSELGFQLGPAARRLAEAFWPGPLTLVVPSRGGFAPGVARADGAVGLRCSAHPLTEALARRLRLAGIGPITATSFNRSGEPPAATLATARALCGEGPDEPRLIDVEGAEAGGDAESTVVDATGNTLQVLRWGALPANEIEPVIEEIERS